MEEKKKIWKNWKVWVGVGAILIVFIVIISLFSKPKFEIVNFSMSSEISNYTYTTNTVRYEGTGVITTQEKRGIYLVVLKKTLKSGGNEEIEKETYISTMIHYGKGEFGTYDYGDEGKITKPEYEFEIVGYLKFN